MNIDKNDVLYIDWLNRNVTLVDNKENALKEWYVSVIDGSYLGDDIHWMFEAGWEHITATLAYCPKEQKWYGRSHRCKRGFGIGDTLDSTKEWYSYYNKEYLERCLLLKYKYVECLRLVDDELVFKCGDMTNGYVFEYKKVDEAPPTKAHTLLEAKAMAVYYAMYAS